MGTSFVDFNGHGYWIQDGFLEGLSFMLAREFEKMPDKEDWQKELVDDWIIAATAGFVGCVPSYLNDYFETPDRLELLRTTLKTIINKLEIDADFLTLADLNDNKIGLGEWHAVNRQGFQKAARLMLDLIDGKLRTNASSPVDYWE
jgi:hypothetical protein